MVSADDSTNYKICQGCIFDGKSVRLVVDGLQIGHVHELKMAGIKSKTDGNPLLHDIAYYKHFGTCFKD